MSVILIVVAIMIPAEFGLMTPPRRRQWLIEYVYWMAERIEIGRR